MPTVRVETVSDAVPPARGAVPSEAPPKRNVINSPSGGGPPAEVTVAVSTTAWPRDEGFGEDVRVVVVENFPMIDWLNADWFPALLPSPAYWAVMERVPTVAKEVVSVA